MTGRLSWRHTASPADLRQYAKLNANTSRTGCVCLSVLLGSYVSKHVCFPTEGIQAPPLAVAMTTVTGSTDWQFKWCLRFWHSFQVCHQSTCLRVLPCCPFASTVFTSITLSRRIQENTRRDELKLPNWSWPSAFITTVFIKKQIPALSDQVESFSKETIHHLWFQVTVYGFGQINIEYKPANNTINRLMWTEGWNTHS